MTTRGPGEGGEEQRISPEARSAFVEYLDRLREWGETDFEGYCAEHPAVAEDLRKLHRSWARIEALERELGLDPDGGTGAEAAVGRIAERLSIERPGRRRYHPEGEIAQGGMGAVLRVRDESLRRTLAMKVVLDGERSGWSEADRLWRFLEEAQITGQLDHPGIVPVHDVGIDERGRFFFTMRLVRGDTLGRIFERVRAGADGWNLTRALGVLSKVCEAMAFAHDRHVVHRDLKPSNVMVGRFGEVYVMDWGLARVLGREDAKDVRLRGQPPSTELRTDRAEASAVPGGPLVTMDGDVVGTPAYMPPEQARGELERIGPASDVYSVGAMLYELLAGGMPYAGPRDDHDPLPPAEVWNRVLAGPPEPLSRLVRDVPPELAAICERAMSREPEDRYPSMVEMADDLRAYLENRVVRAHRTGPLVELRKWFARNRAVAASLLALVAVAVAASLAIAWLERRRADAIRRSSDYGLAQELLAQEAELGPIHPGTVAARGRWLERARELVAHRDGYAAELARLREDALPADESQLEEDRRRHPEYDELVSKETLLARWSENLAANRTLARDPGAAEEDRAAARRAAEVLERESARIEEEVRLLSDRVGRRRRWELPDAANQLGHDRLARLVDALDRLEAEDGPIARVQREHALARDLRRITVEERRAAWDAALAALADPAGPYGGLAIGPQVGLVPIGPDPRSGLQEFWAPLTGAEPRRDEEDRLVLEEDTGVVLVLVPGGRFLMGAQSEFPGYDNHDPDAHPSEGPPVEVELAPYFLSKHELTQGQWLHVTGENPSGWYAGYTGSGCGTLDRLHPVERVSRDQARQVLARVGLTLPTEAQWERAARAGTGTVFPWGNRFEDAGVNHADRSYYVAALGLDPPANARIDDGYPITAPVTAGATNAFGLVGMQGNVSEWCLDAHAATYASVLLEPGIGEVLSDDRRLFTVRGGSFKRRTWDMRCARRFGVPSDEREGEIGLRPARALERSP